MAPRYVGNDDGVPPPNAESNGLMASTPAWDEFSHMRGPGLGKLSQTEIVTLHQVADQHPGAARAGEEGGTASRAPVAAVTGHGGDTGSFAK